MKKLIIIISLLAITPYQVLANAAAELQTRLNKISSFQANFMQKVTSVDGDLIQQAEGQIWIRRPNLFNCYIVSQNDEIWLISDGINLWIYNPFIEQVTVTSLSSITTDTPFMLIARNNPQDWKSYHIRQNGHDFLLKSIHNKKNLKHFSITVQPDGTIKQFTVVEQDGQMTLYQLKEQKNNQVDNNKFKFIPPQGVTVDDQRLIR